MKTNYRNMKVGIMSEQSTALQAGQQAPAFSLRNGEGRNVSLSD